MEHKDRRVEGSFSQGWPMALFITALAVGSFVTAGLIHNRTFRSPNDVTAAYEKEGAAAAAHEAAPATKTGH